LTKYLSIKGRKIGCRLIIFDKDGTLTDFSKIWIPLTKKRIACIIEEVNGPEVLGESLMKSWGVDLVTDWIDPRGVPVFRLPIRRRYSLLPRSSIKTDTRGTRRNKR